MAPRQKTLQELVRDESFLARRHARLLVSDPLVDDDDGLRALQERYRAEDGELERQRLALQFQKAVRDPLQRVQDLPVPDDAGGQERSRHARRLELEAELDAILHMPPAIFDPGANRRATERFFRVRRARDLRRDGLSLQAVAERLSVSRATVTRYLRELG